MRSSCGGCTRRRRSTTQQVGLSTKRVQRACLLLLWVLHEEVESVKLQLHWRMTGIDVAVVGAEAVGPGHLYARVRYSPLPYIVSHQH
mgnify:CR=1 FL=1